MAIPSSDSMFLATIGGCLYQSSTSVMATRSDTSPLDYTKSIEDMQLASSYGSVFNTTPTFQVHRVEGDAPYLDPAPRSAAPVHHHSHLHQQSTIVFLNTHMWTSFIICHRQICFPSSRLASILTGRISRRSFLEHALDQPKFLSNPCPGSRMSCCSKLAILQKVIEEYVGSPQQNQTIHKSDDGFKHAHDI